MHVTPELLSRYDRPGPRYTSYPTAVHFHEGFDADAYVDHLERASQQDDPLSVYIHLPFCQQRCLYCACNVVIDRYGKVAHPYLERLRREIDMVAEHLGARRAVSQLHFGGGTPTYYKPDEIFSLMQFWSEKFTLQPGGEFSVEIDPRVTAHEHLDALAEFGLNRVSLGVQDLDPQVQEAIGRIQSFEQTATLIEHARGLGVESTNIDLIYGLPYQTERSLAETIEQVLLLRPERLAVYGFAYVPWVAGHQKKLPKEHLPGPTERVRLLSLAGRLLEEAGYEAIGMDHFALPESDLCQARGQGALSRNFMGYTTSRAPDMIGFGLSAIGEVAGAYVQNIKRLADYMRAIDAGKLPVERGVAMTQDDMMRAHMIRELMCNLHLDLADVRARFGPTVDLAYSQALPELEQMADEGMLVLEPGMIRVTELGQLFVRNIAMSFDGYLPHQDTSRAMYSRTV